MWIHRPSPFVFEKIPYRVHLHGICDTQEGSRSTHLGLVDARIQEICEDPYSAVIIPGDIEDEDRPSTRERRRSAFADRLEVPARDAEKHIAWLDRAIIPRYLKLAKNTKYGILGILAGHHWTQLSPAMNSVQYICRELERKSGRPVPYLGQMSAYVVLTFQMKGPRGAGRQALSKVVHVQHGEGGGQTKASTLNKLERTQRGFAADAYIRAHDCQIVGAKYAQLYPKAGDGEPTILSKNIAVLNLGSATMGYELSRGEPSYVEAKMMSPTAMGWGTMKFRVRRAHTFEDPSHNLICDIKVEI